MYKSAACRYFAHLSKASDLTSDFIPPTVSQIRQVNVQLRANQLLPAAQLLDLCQGTGVHEGTLKKVSLHFGIYLTPRCCDHHQETHVLRQHDRLFELQNSSSP